MTTPNTVPVIAIQEGASVLGPDGALLVKLTGLSFLEMAKDPAVRIPEGTDLDVPQEGHKASTGTETKGPGTRIGSPADVPPPGVEMLVPACILRETAEANRRTELAEGSKIKTNLGEPPLIVLKTVTLVSVKA